MLECQTIEASSTSSSMLVQAQILMPDGQHSAVSDVLCDTGASANYISLTFLDQHRAYFRQITPVSGRQVKLGDGVTAKKILFEARCMLRFYNAHGEDKNALPKFHDIEVIANVFDNSGHSIIIGLPTLVTGLYDFFVRLLGYSRDAVYQQQVHRSLSVLEVGDLVKPFPFRSEEAPEDAETPLPGHFDDALYAMMVDLEERTKAYEALFDTHVSPEFAAATPVIQLLRTLGSEVFIARNWDGINGINPVEFEFRDLPESHSCKARPINPKLAENFYKELERLMTYLFVPSSSPIVSPIVVAYKATHPFIRVCGDFTWINRYIVMPIVPIPPAFPLLEKIRRFRYFLDVDVTNAFHQIPLGDRTSHLLSIITPRCTVRPKFLLEGTTPASGILHMTMVDMFRDFEDWTIVLFDNILILAESYEDGYAKLERFLTRCKERNLFLKFEKSWLGFQEVKFFGYICRHNEVYLSEERTKAILDIPFPENTKQMQSFLGSCLFFKSFIPDYSQHAAKLNDMVHKSFDWSDESKWVVDYRSEFDKLKAVVSESFSLFYPDYTLPWILRVDASAMGIGSVLLQDKDGVLQPIIFQSHKFSKQAMNWSTIEQECYAIYYSVHQLAYYLRCKEFIIETDHRNLVWMYQSEVPKIIRWHIYLQSFNFLIRHIPGKYNIVADMLSRQWTSPVKEFSDALLFLCTVQEEGLDYYSMMRQVHGRRAGHLGVKRTWFLLNKLFPGHGISVARVADYISECPVCQKDRLRTVASIPPVVKTLHVTHARSTVGVDTFEVTPAEDGKRYLLVLVNFFTRYVKLYAVTNKDALTTATCIFDYICTFGLFDQLRSDPGSDFTSEVVEHLLKWLGPTRSFTLVDNPQADGVEGTNLQIHRHLLAICMDERCKSTWSSPTVLPIIQLILNEHTSSETGVTPFHAQFGDADAIYAKIPAGLPTLESTHSYIRLLDANLKMIREISAEYQANIKAKRIENPPDQAANRYAAGDLVLFRSTKEKRMDKLTPRNLGPLEVIRHIPDTNWVEVRDLIYGNVRTIDMSDLQVYFGDKESAKRMAEYDHDQYQIDRIGGHRGHPETRTTMEFLVHFLDGTSAWLPWTRDLADTKQFEAYCDSLPQLHQLLQDASVASRLKISAKKSDITLVSPKSVVYVDIREWGPGTWYSNLASLPNKDTVTYVLRCEYQEFCGPKNFPRRKIKAFFPALNATYDVDNWFVSTYGHKFTKPLPEQVVLSKRLIAEYAIDFVN